MNEAVSIGAKFDAVPAVDLPPERLDERLIVGFDSYDNRSRPYNLLRTQLTKILDRTGDRLIGLTSATPAAGKTFTSVNLAAALSKMEGRKVVLCDFDLRRGSILKQFGVSVALALDDYLAGNEQDWTNLLFRVNNNNLFVLPTRTVLRDSSEAIGSERFVELVRQLRALPDDYMVLCDLPPVFANDDAMLCMRHLDAYVLVVDHGRTTGRQIEESTALLEPSRCLGTVLNRYQGGFGDDYGYGYGDTYGLKDYYADEN
ncbi:MAG: hypothetical protein B7Z08_00255 [Sphingomonadales bacterium 32-68-7]|nr:MAG: hypothetical protein B7Z33_09320 [Sphingomonadales bacterium 12-68-11]OYX10566.1 MAG: hypothetical protein B7Z08_00255 [Sphingomonadales bacterium 32-68-7]